MFSENSRIKLEINNRRIFGKFPNIWKVNDTLLITHVWWLILCPLDLAKGCPILGKTLFLSVSMGVSPEEMSM